MTSDIPTQQSDKLTLYSQIIFVPFLSDIQSNQAGMTNSKEVGLKNGILSSISDVQPKIGHAKIKFQKQNQMSKGGLFGDAKINFSSLEFSLK